ncbi:MAG TPA: hypothetical protein VLM37_11350 [Fibrobacteraceae bacterium]|nr:hypothetical protein [Fibrobacteraceae bacterium]
MQVFKLSFLLLVFALFLVACDDSSSNEDLSSSSSSANYDACLVKFSSVNYACIQSPDTSLVVTQNLCDSLLETVAPSFSDLSVSAMEGCPADSVVTSCYYSDSTYGLLNAYTYMEGLDAVLCNIAD